MTPDHNNSAPGQWPAVARNWQHIGAPLRPSAEDSERFGSVIAQWNDAHPERTPRGLILGVTPELFALAWPDRALLRAADRTEAMIEHIWPGPRSAALMNDWRALDLPDASVDIVMCDGGLHLLDYPRGQAALCAELARVVCAGGLVAFRLFVPPTRTEPVEAVLQSLHRGAIRDLNCLKLRLGMALQGLPEQGVALADVWRTLRAEAGSDWNELAARLAWPFEQLQVIDAYRDSGASYHFVSTEQAVALFGNAGFECLAIHPQPYAMGDQCPVVVFGKC